MMPEPCFDFGSVWWGQFEGSPWFSASSELPRCAAGDGDGMGRARGAGWWWWKNAELMILLLFFLFLNMYF